MEILCWLLLAAILIIMEIVSLGLTTIWFAGGAFAAAIVGALGANLAIQVICFIVVSMVLLFFTRPIAVKHLDARTEKTNVEALVGKKAIVISEINNLSGTGRVKIDGMEWAARASEDTVVISEGEQVRIIEIQGVKLIVEKLQMNEEKE